MVIPQWLVCADGTAALLVHPSELVLYLGTGTYGTESEVYELRMLQPAHIPYVIALHRDKAVLSALQRAIVTSEERVIDCAALLARAAIAA